MAVQEAEMKRAITVGITLFGLVLGLGVAAVSAQVSTQYRANIPFDFKAKGVEFAAGTYTVGPLSANSSASALALRNKETGNTKILGVMQALGDGKGNTGTLRFTRVGDHYVLAEIITPTFERRFMKIPKMRELAKSENYPREVVIKLNW